MEKYYTRACNFYYGSISKEKIKKKLSLPLNGNDLISFDNIEINSMGFELGPDFSKQVAEHESIKKASKSEVVKFKQDKERNDVLLDQQRLDQQEEIANQNDQTKRDIAALKEVKG